MSPDNVELHPARLIDAWLTHATITENRDFDAMVQVIYSVAYETTVDFAGKTPTAQLTLELHWQDSEGGDVTGPFELEVAVVGEFDLGEVADPDPLRSWLEFSAPHLLWPYARAYISTITGLTSHMPLTLFLIQVPRPRALEPDTSDFEAPHG